MRQRLGTWLVVAVAWLCVAAAAQAVEAAAGSLYGWGSNEVGQLGGPTGTGLALDELPMWCPTATAAAGGMYSLMVGTDGSLWACGDNSSGQLGDGTARRQGTPTRVLARGVAAVAAGYAHTLILKTDGSLWACGGNGAGQLGDGTATDRLTPVRILDSGVAAVVAGYAHTLIVKTNGSLWACGWNSNGQLGDGTTTDRLTPVRILYSGVATVAAGYAHTLIVKTDGALWACGFNSSGQLGDGTSTDRAVPVRILNSGIAAAAAGARHSLALGADGSLWSCGENTHGQLGDGTISNRTTPRLVLAGGVAAVAAGVNHTLIVKTDGSLWAGGDNQYGQLGDGTATERWAPTRVVDHGVASVASSGQHSLILRTDAIVLSCGDNSGRQLGRRTGHLAGPRHQGADAVAGVATGDWHTLVVKTDGSLWACGGNGSGELGDGTTSTRLAPVRILDSGAAAVAAGASHTLVTKADGSLWACGANDQGQLGDRTGTRRLSLVHIVGAGVTAVAAGDKHTLIVKTDGSLWVCGQNNWGQLGSGTGGDRSTPLRILGSGVAAVAAGHDHTLIVKTDGSLWACGWNEDNQLGDGTATYRLTPTRVMTGALVAAAGQRHSLALAGPATMVIPSITALRPDYGAARTGGRHVILANHATGAPTQYQASENAGFAGAAWLPYSKVPAFILSTGLGPKTVYVRVRNAVGESVAFSGSIELVVPLTPTVSLSGSAVSLGRLLPGTITFSRASTGFTDDDIEVTNGSVTSFRGAGTEYRFTLVPNAPGTVTLRVPADICADADGLPNEASETVTVQCVPGSEPDDAPEQATALQNGALIADSIHRTDDVDWFVFTLPAGPLAYGLTAATTGPAGDTILSLFGPGNAGGLIECDDDSGDGAFSRVRRTAWAAALLPGTYYVRVEAKGTGTIDAYTLAISWSPFYTVGFSDGTYLAVVDAATAAAAGRGLWDLTGHYETTSACGYPLRLDLVHDSLGRLSGRGALALASSSILLAATGTVRGTGGLPTLALSLNGEARPLWLTVGLRGRVRLVRSEPPASAQLRLTLGLDAVARALSGVAAMHLEAGADSADAAVPCVLALPASMDGSFILQLDLTFAGRTVGGSAALRLASGATYPLQIQKGWTEGTALTLALTGGPADPATRGLRLTVTVTPLEDGSARLEAITAQALGQTLAW